MEVRRAIEAFVKIYNEPGSYVYPLFAECVDWAEKPSGRHGGRAELFTALREVREIYTNLHLEVLSIVADGRDGVLESMLSGIRVSDDAPLLAHVIWFLTFIDGKIVKEHDYSMLISSSC